MRAFVEEVRSAVTDTIPRNLDNIPAETRLGVIEWPGGQRWRFTRNPSLGPADEPAESETQVGLGDVAAETGTTEDVGERPTPDREPNIPVDEAYESERRGTIKFHAREGNFRRFLIAAEVPRDVMETIRGLGRGDPAPFDTVEGFVEFWHDRGTFESIAGVGAALNDKLTVAAALAEEAITGEQPADVEPGDIFETDAGNQFEVTRVDAGVATLRREPEGDTFNQTVSEIADNLASGEWQMIEQITGPDVDVPEQVEEWTLDTESESRISWARDGLHLRPPATIPREDDPERLVDPEFRTFVDVRQGGRQWFGRVRWEWDGERETSRRFTITVGNAKQKAIDRAVELMGGDTDT